MVTYDYTDRYREALSLISIREWKKLRTLKNLTWKSEGETLTSPTLFSFKAAEQAKELFESFKVPATIAPPPDNIPATGDQCVLALDAQSALPFFYLIEEREKKLAKRYNGSDENALPALPSNRSRNNDASNIYKKLAAGYADHEFLEEQGISLEPVKSSTRER